MKKILAFMLAVMMVFSLLALCACDNSGENDDASSKDEFITDFDLCGEWKVTSTDDEVEWFLNPQGVMHITKAVNDQKFTTVCNYTYDRETGVFEYTGLSADVSFKGSAEIDGKTVSITAEDNSQVIVLYKNN